MERRVTRRTPRDKDTSSRRGPSARPWCRSQGRSTTGASAPSCMPTSTEEVRQLRPPDRAQEDVQGAEQPPVLKGVELLRRLLELDHGELPTNTGNRVAIRPEHMLNNTRETLADYSVAELGRLGLQFFLSVVAAEIGQIIDIEMARQEPEGDEANLMQSALGSAGGSGRRDNEDRPVWRPRKRAKAHRRRYLNRRRRNLDQNVSEFVCEAGGQNQRAVILTREIAKQLRTALGQREGIQERAGKQTVSNNF